jgi:branched-chain amino acid transport system ATP-binding protein
MNDVPVLSVINLQSRHDGALKLSDVSLHVAQKELVSILGANGAGKTSLLGVISGLFKPSAGEVQLEGRSITALPAHEIAKAGVGFAPQNHPIFPSLTVDECLALGAGNAKLETFVLFPNLKIKRNQLAGFLSGGERQMLSMAIAMLNSPKICIFDEPSSGLAPRIVSQVFEAIRAIVDNGVTVLMVEQNARTALKIADRAYVMEHGRITMSGKAAELAENDHIRRAYLGL